MAPIQPDDPTPSRPSRPSSSSSSNRPHVSVPGQGGKVEADQGGNVTIIPDKGYAIDKVTVNGQEVSVPADGKLTGLKPTDWFYDSVKAIVEQELMNGTGSFGPDDPITREQLAAMLARFCQRER